MLISIINMQKKTIWSIIFGPCLFNFSQNTRCFFLYCVFFIYQQKCKDTITEKSRDYLEFSSKRNIREFMLHQKKVFSSNRSEFRRNYVSFLLFGFLERQYIISEFYDEIFISSSKTAIFHIANTGMRNNQVSLSKNNWFCRLAADKTNFYFNELSLFRNWLQLQINENF